MTPPDRGPASGRGLLDARAHWACVVGPERLAMAPKHSALLKVTESTKLSENIAAADVYVFVGIIFPLVSDIPLTALLSKDSEMGLGSAVASQLQPAGQFGSAIGIFTQLLLPGEQLFGRLSGLIENQTSGQVVVAEVRF